MDLRRTVVVFSLAFLCVVPEAALAHAFPDHADPKVGATVSGPPARVRIWFDSELEPAFSTIVVQSSGGKRVDKGDGHVNSSDETLLEVSLPSLNGGTYRVMWSVVARDGHRTMGDYTFVIQ